jgi:hypothetical protein
MQQKRFKDIDIDLPKFSVWKYSDTELRFFLKNSRKNTKLNELLKQYPKDTDFSSKDEPVFKLSIQDVVRYKSQITDLTGIGSNVFDLV